jgi:hypothetical protein
MVQIEAAKFLKMFQTVSAKFPQMFQVDSAKFPTDVPDRLCKGGVTLVETLNEFNVDKLNG